MTARALGLASAVALAGCGVGLDGGGPWISAESIDGPLRPELRLDDYLPADAPDRLRVVTFNVEFGERVNALADAIMSVPDLAGADVLLVQEIEAHASEPGSRAARLADALAMNVAYAPARELGDGTHGLAVLSRFPLADVAVMELPRSKHPIHSYRRVALAATVVAGPRDVRVYDLHLAPRMNIGDRVSQAHPVVESIAGSAIVAGDFNTNPFLWVRGVVPLLPAYAAGGFDQAELFDGYMRAMAFDTPTDGSGPTQDAGIARFRLDAIYTRGLAAGDTGLATEVTLSDHTPLWLDVTLP